jgi:hypothetical protein
MDDRIGREGRGGEGGRGGRVYTHTPQISLDRVNIYLHRIV